MVTQMIAVGEDAGALRPCSSKIADFYDEEVADDDRAAHGADRAAHDRVHRRRHRRHDHRALHAHLQHRHQIK